MRSARRSRAATPDRRTVYLVTPGGGMTCVIAPFVSESAARRVGSAGRVVARWPLARWWRGHAIRSTASSDTSSLQSAAAPVAYGRGDPSRPVAADGRGGGRFRRAGACMPNSSSARVERLDDAVRVEVQPVAWLERQALVLEHAVLDHSDREARRPPPGGSPRREAAVPGPGGRQSRSGTSPERASITPYTKVKY